MNILVLVLAAIIVALIAYLFFCLARPIVDEKAVEEAAREKAKATIARGFDHQAENVYLNASLVFRQIESEDLAPMHASYLRSDGPFWSSWTGDAIQMSDR